MATFQEFYCVSAGTNGASNMNAGDKLTSPVTTTNGAYTQGGGAGGGTSDLFVAASGTPFSGAAVGDYLSIYADGATTPAFVGRISAKNSSTSVDIDSTKSSGTRPTTAASGKTATLGGAWLGPTGAVGHPFGFIAAASTDGSGNTPRVNGVGTSNITAAMTHGLVGPVQFEGMTSSPGDGGRWTIDGGTSGTSYTLLTASQRSVVFEGLTFQNNGASGSADGVVTTNVEQEFRRCVMNSLRGCGHNIGSSGYAVMVECEAYACNQSGTTNLAGFANGDNGLTGGSGSTYLRCVSHGNAGAGSLGFYTGSGHAPTTYVGCVADTNNSHGFFADGASMYYLACDAYNNGGSGVVLRNNGVPGVLYLENCNFVKNGGWGVNGSGTQARCGRIVNCGFGSGTQVNTSGTTTGLKSMVESGSVTYASGVTPWVDPANGDFRINLAAAKGVGRGTFTQTAAAYAGAVGYPDIGAVQGRSFIKSSGMKSGGPL